MESIYGHSFKRQNPAIDQAIMNPMKSLSLIVCLILTVGYLTSVIAVTDAELEALEKQIEQQEVEEKQQAEVKEKKKAETEAKQRAEAKRKFEEETKRKAEAEAKRKAEDARLAELERQRQEDEAKKKAEEEKKEKYTLLITEAKQAMNDRDKDLAYSKYYKAMVLIPGDPVAFSGLQEASKLLHKKCYEVLGNWVSEAGKVDIKEDGTFTWDNGAASGSGTWECSNPKAGKFDFITPSAWIGDWTSILNEDGRCLSFWNKDCWTRRN